VSPRDDERDIQSHVASERAGPETSRLPDAELARLVATIRSSLEVDGLARITRRLTLDDFEALGEMIGIVELRTDIRVDRARREEQMGLRNEALGRSRPGVYQAEALALHTDRPTASILAWYCVAQDDRAGATVLLDTSDLAEHFSAEELAALRGVSVSYTLRRPGSRAEEVFRHPLLSGTDPPYQLYYVPWNISETASVEERRALVAFANYLLRAQERRAIRIRLEPGEALFINNHRLLHGRDALPQDSRRHLVRLYIRTPNRP
jgi:hypothetical protein